MKTLTIARLTFMEARQRRLLWVVALLGLAFLILFTVGFYFAHRDISRATRGFNDLPEANNLFLMAGLYVVNFLIVMLAVLTSVDSIAGEVASGTIFALVTKPLHRWEIVLGKWLGLAVMLSVFTLILTVAMVVIVWVIADYVPPNPVPGVALMLVEGLVVLTLSVLGGTRLPTLTNGVVLFMLYGLAFIAGWIEQIGGFLQNETSVNIGILVSLIMPSEAMWKMTAWLMQPTFLRQLGASPFASVNPPSTAMLIYTLLYIGVVLLLALRFFQRRDL